MYIGPIYAFNNDCALPSIETRFVSKQLYLQNDCNDLHV